MPRKAFHQEKEGVAKAKRARRLLTGKGIAREDSDDELGLEEHPWSWIYADDVVGSIVGASHGKFECKLGDCVLLKAEGTSQAWVGIICDFQEDEEGEKVANFMWFSTEKEIRNKDKKRTDSLPNELYITPAWDINPLASINGTAKVMSPGTFNAEYPNGCTSHKVFICRRACNTRTTTYSPEFEWEHFFEGAEHIDEFIDSIKNQTKAARKQKSNAPDDEWDQLAAGTILPSTPRKRQKLSQPSQMKGTIRTPSKLTTPAHKRIVVKKPLEFTPLGTRILSPSYTTSSPYQIARSRLHVSSVPAALPCREAAFATVYSHLEAAISDGLGSCIYISGTPGTGKTATVREVVVQLNIAVMAEELDDFIFVEINGMKVTDPHQSYSLLWEALKGNRVSPSHAMDLLEREFSNPSPRRVPCVVLMDELDQLVTKNQSVMYNFFNWPGLRHSRLIVLAVANTMDLPERTLSNKISSRLGLTRITFPGYTHEQLMKIIESRLEGVPGNIVDPDAIQFASRKVAAVSGDARRALDICRRAVEIAETNASDDRLLETPSRRNKGQDTPLVQRATGRVTIGIIKQAISEATSSPLQLYLKSQPLASKLLLAALLARTRRSGIAESTLGDVIDEARRLTQLSEELPVKDFLSLQNNIIAPELSSNGRDKIPLAPRVLAIGEAAMELMEAGVIGLEPRKGERTGKLRLNIAEDELRLALKDDTEVRGLGLS